ncbi:MAG: hypothetical protein M9924_03025 [Rhizobiaceae bacterium]|nr:hypothetical protein [Rhizobiaceae bacterium]
MEGDEADRERRSIPSLAHALEEARARAKFTPRIDAPEEGLETRARRPAMRKRSGSLLDFATPSATAPSDSRIEAARLAVEADAARRALSARDAKASSQMQDSMGEMRAAIEECLVAIRECREMVRALATRRDRNYF